MWYLLVNLDQADYNPTTAYLISDGMNSVRETVFAGDSTGTLNSVTTIKQSYSVGTADFLETSTSSLGTAGSGSMGVILPTLEEESCLKDFTETLTVEYVDLILTTNYFEEDDSANPTIADMDDDENTINPTASFTFT